MNTWKPTEADMTGLVRDAIEQLYVEQFVDKQPPLETEGICRLVRDRVAKAWMRLARANGYTGIDFVITHWCDEDVIVRLMYLFKQWPHYSGIPFYPVPAWLPTEDSEHWSPVSPSAAFNYRTGNMFSRDTAYGRARLNLLEYLYNTTKLKETNGNPSRTQATS